jgi:pimeloyl-ACP methyl ester carboxylesterase
MLVHGAWHGAWCWELVAAALAARDLDAVAIDLPGHGDDPGPLTDLHGDAQRVRRALDGFDRPGVLVGHSYGGAVVTEAGVHDAVAELLYIASFNLDTGESAMSAAVAESEAAHIDHSGRPDALDHIAVDSHGISTIDPDGAPILFYDDCRDEVAEWAIARLGPQPMANLSQAPNAIAWRHRPSTYAVCTLDNVVHPALQRILARRADRALEWMSGHSPFLSCPEVVADAIADIARRTT